MNPIVCAFIAFVTTLLRSRLSLQIEIAALRHQLAVYERSARRATHSPRRPYTRPPGRGTVVELPEIGGLHHHYERSVA